MRSSLAPLLAALALAAAGSAYAGDAPATTDTTSTPATPAADGKTPDVVITGQPKGCHMEKYTPTGSHMVKTQQVCDGDQSDRDAISRTMGTTNTPTTGMMILH